MSFLNVNQISTAAGAPSFTTAAGGININGNVLGAGNASIMKNRIINGAMVINQRAGSPYTPNNSYTLDRWASENSQTSKFTVTQSSTAPAGFNNSLLVTSSSAYSSGSSDYFDICQRIEGYNVADLNWGTANAKTITLSFWVQSSLTGTFSGALQATAAGRSYPFTYTISSANTWTQASITIVGDTSGTWNTTNGIGIQVCFDLGSGTSLRGTAGSWSSNWYIGATGSVSVVGTSGATFYITGVQLEVGSNATGYEYRQYGTELALCQRYWQQSYNAGTVAGTATQVGAADILPGTNGTGTMGCFSYFRTEMRTIPTVTLYDLTGASGKVYKGANGKTGAIQNQATTGFTGYTSDSTSTAEMLYQWTATAEL